MDARVILRYLSINEIAINHYRATNPSCSMMFKLNYYPECLEIIGNIHESTIILPKK